VGGRIDRTDEKRLVVIKTKVLFQHLDAVIRKPGGNRGKVAVYVGMQPAFVARVAPSFGVHVDMHRVELGLDGGELRHRPKEVAVGHSLGDVLTSKHHTWFGHFYFPFSTCSTAGCPDCP